MPGHRRLPSCWAMLVLLQAAAVLLLAPPPSLAIELDTAFKFPTDGDWMTHAAFVLTEEPSVDSCAMLMPSVRRSYVGAGVRDGKATTAAAETATPAADGLGAPSSESAETAASEQAPAPAGVTSAVPTDSGAGAPPAAGKWTNARHARTCAYMVPV